jgi:hypothetical protein
VYIHLCSRSSILLFLLANESVILSASFAFLGSGARRIPVLPSAIILTKPMLTLLPFCKNGNFIKGAPASVLVPFFWIISFMPPLAMRLITIGDVVCATRYSFLSSLAMVYSSSVFVLFASNLPPQSLALPSIFMVAGAFTLACCTLGNFWAYTLISQT